MLNLIKCETFSNYLRRSQRLIMIKRLKFKIIDWTTLHFEQFDLYQTVVNRPTALDKRKFLEKGIKSKSRNKANKSTIKDR